MDSKTILICDDDPTVRSSLSLVLKRAEAKKAKDFAQADAIRTQLKDLGVEVTDVPGGAVWKRV